MKINRRNNTRWQRIVLLSSLCWCCPVISWADPLQELLHLLEPIKGFRADFSQDTFDAQKQLIQHNEGSLVAQAPSRFYWKTLDPYPQEVITDGKTLWIYDPDLQQVTEKPFDDNYSKTPAMLFTGNSQRIADEFSVLALPAGTSPAGTAPNAASSDVTMAFRLVPKQAQQALFKALEMTFEQGKPASMVIEDAMQQRTVLHFSAVETNPTVDAAQFHFVTPPGVDVLRAK